MSLLFKVCIALLVSSSLYAEEAKLAPIEAPSLPQAAPPALTPVPVANTAEHTADYGLYAKSEFANPKWDTLVQAGFQSYAAGNVMQAVDFLQKAVAGGTASPFVSFKLAASYEFLGNHATAIQYYSMTEKELEKLPHDHPYYTQFYESYARALLSNKQEAEAIPMLERTAATTQEYWVLSRLADYYLSHNDLDRALPYLLRAVEVPGIRQVPTPQIAQIYLVISKIYLHKENSVEAYRYADYAVQTDPQNMEAAKMKQNIDQHKRQDRLHDQMKQMMEWYE